jgi:hypothetical protein
MKQGFNFRGGGGVKVVEIGEMWRRAWLVDKRLDVVRGGK